MPIHHPHHKIRKNNPDYFDSVMSLIAILSPLSMAPQVYQIYRLKDVSGISQTMWLISVATSVTWLVYGFHRKDKPIIFNSTMGAILCSAISIGVYLYN